MDKNLEEEIVSVAPWMFRYDGYDDPQQSLLCFGFEISEGWFNILKDLVIKLSQIDTEKKIRFVQVKEKFGQLRIYTGGYTTETIDDLIWKAEKLSSETCENCGKPSKNTNRNGWMSTVCVECESEDFK